MKLTERISALEKRIGGGGQLHIRIPHVMVDDVCEGECGEGCATSPMIVLDFSPLPEDKLEKYQTSRKEQ